VTQEIKAKIIAPDKDDLYAVDQYLIDILNNRYSVIEDLPKKLHNNTKSKISSKSRS